MADQQKRKITAWDFAPWIIGAAILGIIAFVLMTTSSSEWLR